MKSTAATKVGSLSPDQKVRQSFEGSASKALSSVINHQCYG
jgi:hypothetical protein